jgi:hypothetical protein
MFRKSNPRKGEPPREFNSPILVGVGLLLLLAIGVVLTVAGLSG